MTTSTARHTITVPVPPARGVDEARRAACVRWHDTYRAVSDAVERIRFAAPERRAETLDREAARWHVADPIMRPILRGRLDYAARCLHTATLHEANGNAAGVAANDQWATDCRIQAAHIITGCPGGPCTGNSGDPASCRLA